MVETTEKVKRKGNKIIVLAKSGYAQGVDKLMTLKDTGNYFVAKFHYDSYSLPIDYDDAEYLYLALKEVFENEL